MNVWTRKDFGLLEACVTMILYQTIDPPSEQQGRYKEWREKRGKEWKDGNKVKTRKYAKGT